MQRSPRRHQPDPQPEAQLDPQSDPQESQPLLPADTTEPEAAKCPDGSCSVPAVPKAGDIDPVNGSAYYEIPTADGGYILAS